MSKIEEWDKRMLRRHDLKERYAAGEELSDEEVDELQSIPLTNAHYEQRLQGLLHKRQFGLD